MRPFRLILLPLLLVACHSMNKEAPEPEPTAAPVSLQGWRSERITLPPEFAPAMPPGDELLLFAPGMFDSEAEDYWSYVFVMRIAERELEAARLNEIFELYYDGLIKTVAEARGGDVGDDPAHVSFESKGEGRFEASVELVDAFVTMRPVHLRLLVETALEGRASTFLRIQASPQPADHELWQSLAAAAQSLEL